MALLLHPFPFSAPISTRRNPKFLVLEHVTPATRLMEKRRQMFEVHETLESQKMEFSNKEELFRVRTDNDTTLAVGHAGCPFTPTSTPTLALTSAPTCF